VVWRSDATGALRAMMPLLPEPQAEPAISVHPPASALNAKMRSASVEEEEDGEGEEEEDAEEEGEEEEEEEGEEGCRQKPGWAAAAAAQSHTVVRHTAPAYWSLPPLCTLPTAEARQRRAAVHLHGPLLTDLP